MLQELRKSRKPKDTSKRSEVFELWSRVWGLGFRAISVVTKQAEISSHFGFRLSLGSRGDRASPQTESRPKTLPDCPLASTRGLNAVC